MPTKKISIGVIGGSTIDDKNRELAFEVGKHIAHNNALLICGGLDGTMEAAAQGAVENGGTTLGFLPGEDKKSANPFINIALPTGMGVGRNILVVRSSDALIAFPGSYGTLSEIALALNTGKTVIYMPGSWNLSKIGQIDSSLFKEAFDAPSAVGLALNAIL